MRLTDSQRDYAGRVAEACSALAPTEADRRRLSADDTSLTSDEAFRFFAGRDLLGVSLPVEDGGAGRTFTEECLLLEETSRTGIPITAYSTALTAAQSYLNFASAEKRREVVGVLRGGGVESITLTEPDAGSDLAAATTTATRDGNEWVLSGRKTWISFAHLARHLLVLARTDANGDRHDGLTLFMVPVDSPGLEILPIPTMGAHMVNDVVLSGVRVPSDAIVGEEGEAWRHLGRGLAVERVIIAAMSVGVAQRALEQLVQWVASRMQFGKPISTKQAVRHRIADLTTEIAHCRSFVYDIAGRIDDGEEDALNAEASMAKLKSTEVAKHTTLEAVQLMGGYGYASAWGMEQQLRAAVAPMIYGGTNEIQREIIGRSLGL